MAAMYHRVALLQVRWQACFAETDAVAAHRHSFSKHKRALRRASRQAAVASHYAAPGQIAEFRRREKPMAAMAATTANKPEQSLGSRATSGGPGRSLDQRRRS